MYVIVGTCEVRVILVKACKDCGSARKTARVLVTAVRRRLESIGGLFLPGRESACSCRESASPGRETISQGRENALRCRENAFGGRQNACRGHDSDGLSHQNAFWSGGSSRQSACT